MNIPAKITALSLIIVSCLGIAKTTFAAVNTAADGGGGFTLADSGAVTINPLAQPTLMKAVYNGATCIASSDGTCGGGSTATTPSGTVLTFVIYVANDATASISLGDIRFTDALDTAVPGGFSYELNSLSYGSATAAATWANAFAAAFTNTGSFDTLDNGDPVNYDAAALPFPTIYAGGDGTVGNNQTVNVAPGDLFAIAFNVTVN